MQLFDPVDQYNSEFLRLQKRLGLSHKQKQVNKKNFLKCIHLKKKIDVETWFGSACEKTKTSINCKIYIRKLGTHLYFVKCKIYIRKLGTHLYFVKCKIYIRKLGTHLYFVKYCSLSLEHIYTNTGLFINLFLQCPEYLPSTGTLFINQLLESGTPTFYKNTVYLPIH